MSRKININLLNSFATGDLNPFLEELKKEENGDFSLESRTGGQAILYHRKSKAIIFKAKGGIELGDKKYGKLSSLSLIKDNPAKVFEEIRRGISDFLKDTKQRAEFDTQQNIVRDNKDTSNQYLVIDMEYTFSRESINKEERTKLMSIDLIGIERSSGNIVMIEVKTGLGAVEGKSGIEDHVKDFNHYIHGKNANTYRNNLYQDVINILSDKITLGIIKDDGIRNRISKEAPNLIFAFEPDLSVNKEEQIKKVKNLIDGRFKLFIIGKDNFELI